MTKTMVVRSVVYETLSEKSGIALKNLGDGLSVLGVLGMKGKPAGTQEFEDLFTLLESQCSVFIPNNVFEGKFSTLEERAQFTVGELIKLLEVYA